MEKESKKNHIQSEQAFLIYLFIQPSQCIIDTSGFSFSFFVGCVQKPDMSRTSSNEWVGITD